MDERKIEIIELIEQCNNERWLIAIYEFVKALLQ